MFKFHRSSLKSPYRSPYYGKRKRNLPPLWLLLPSIPLTLILLEILARLAIGISGQGKELANYQGEPAIVTAYRLKFLAPDKRPYAGLPDRGELVARRSLYMGYELASNQKNQLWQINEQGFRDDKPIPLAKPKDEVRIFILGNSTAFGQGSQGNASTIAAKLETRLQERVAQQQKSPEKYRPNTLSFYKPERDKALALPPKIRPGNYRAIDAAVPGYTSGNHLAQLALKILPYKPDVIVILGGYTDLMLPGSETATTIPKLDSFLTNASGHYWAAVSQSVGEWVTNSALYKSIQYWVFRPEAPLAEETLGVMARNKSLTQHLAVSDPELERRIQRYRENYKQLIQLCAGARIPVVLALQPEVTGRSPDAMTNEETALVKDLGNDYQQRVQKGYAQLASVQDRLKKAYPNNVYVYNFYKLDKPAPDRAFSDPIHLTEAANTEMAKRLYDALTGIPKMQIVPENFKLK